MAVDLDRAKAHLGIDWTQSADQEALLQAQLAAAIGAVETHAQTLLTERAVTQRVDGLVDRLGRSTIRLHWGPVRSVEGIDYLDTDGVAATLTEGDGELRVVAGVPGLLMPPLNEAWPAVHGDAGPGAVTIRYTAGYGGSGEGAAGPAPGELEAAVLMMVGHFWHNREAVVTGGGATELPLSVAALCHPFRHTLL